MSLPLKIFCLRPDFCIVCERVKKKKETEKVKAIETEPKQNTKAIKRCFETMKTKTFSGTKQKTKDFDEIKWGENHHYQLFVPNGRGEYYPEKMRRPVRSRRWRKIPAPETTPPPFACVVCHQTQKKVLLLLLSFSRCRWQLFFGWELEKEEK